MTVYILHITPPYVTKRGNRTVTAKHYVGFTNLPTPDERLRRHNEGTGGIWTGKVEASGSTFNVVVYFPGAPIDLERRIKTEGARSWCPRCSMRPRTPECVEMPGERTKRESQRRNNNLNADIARLARTQVIG